MAGADAGEEPDALPSKESLFIAEFGAGEAFSEGDLYLPVFDAPEGEIEEDKESGRGAFLTVFDWPFME